MILYINDVKINPLEAGNTHLCDFIFELAATRQLLYTCNIEATFLLDFQGILKRMDELFNKKCYMIY